MSYEANYWGQCLNTFDEEQKHYVYARYMGLQQVHYSFVLPKCSSVLDIGGGPVSMLLKTTNIMRSAVCDPLQIPDWVQKRYEAANILYFQGTYAQLPFSYYDEVWIYNVLQHVDQSEDLLRVIRTRTKVLRLFEWIDIPPYEGHPTMLTEALLNQWLHSKGKTVQLAESGCYGKAYYIVL